MWWHLHRAQEQYDVIHVHSYHSLSASGSSAAVSRPVVTTPHYHGTGHSRFRASLHRPYRPVGRRLLGRSELIIAVSNPEAELIADHFPTLTERVRVVPNGVTLAPLLQAGQTAQTDPHLLLVVGRLETYKRVDRVIEALDGLPPEVTLAIVGNGPARPALEAMASAPQRRGRVRFLGRVSDAELAKLLVEASVLVSASQHEAFGLTVVDGLAAGASVVASDIPAHRDLLRVVAPDAPLEVTDTDDLQALRAAVRRGLERDRRRPGQTVVPLWSDVAEQTLAVYEEAIQRANDRERT